MVLSISLTFLAYSLLLVKDVLVLDMHLEIGDRLGFNLDTDALYFGKVIPGTSSVTKFANVSNTEDYPVVVNIKMCGELGEWVIISEDKFVLKGGEVKELSLSALPPEGTPFGNYTGKLKAVARRKI